MPKLKYTAELLAPIVADSRSFRDVVIRLGCKPHGQTIALITARIRQYGLSTGHFTGRHWARGCVSNRLKSAHEVLQYGTVCKAYQLVRALVESGTVLVCATCKRKTWLGRKLPLQVHHKDGDKCNNRASNLELLCPNCHAQSDHFCFRGRKHG